MQDHFKTTLEAIGKHSCRTLECSQDTSPLFDRLELCTLKIQAEPVSNPTTGDVSIAERVTWKIIIRNNLKRESKLLQNLNTSCSIVLGQCVIEMRSSIEESPNCESIDRSKNALELLKLIKKNYHSSTNRNPTMSALEVRIKSCNHSQK